MRSPLKVHEALLSTTYPTSLTLSRDGHRLAYIAGSGVGTPQLLVLDTESGATPSAARTVELDGFPVLVRWARSPGRLWIVVAPHDAEPCRLALHDLDHGVVLASVMVAGAIEDLVVVDDLTVALRVADPGSDRDGMNLGVRVTGAATDPRVEGSPPPLRRLVLAQLEPGEQAAELRLTGLDLGVRTLWDFDLRADRLIAVVSQDHLPAGYYRPSLVVADLDGTHLTSLREICSTERQLARPRLSPDGRTAVVLEGISIVSGRVLTVDLASATIRPVPHLDDVTDFGWLSDDSGYVAGWHNLGVQIGTVTGLLETQPTSVTWRAPASMPGDGAQPSLTVAPSGRAYAVWEAPDSAPEVVSLSLTKPGTIAVSRHNSDLQYLAAGVRTEQVAWASADGTEIHGLLLTPADGAPGPRPLVALLHGGPTWLWSSAFAPAESNHLALPLVAAGAAVLLPNPRGSSGRGQAFASAVFGHIGSLDLDDVIAGVDHFVRIGAVDPARVGVMGLSYGGYLSALASLRTDVFSAAVVMSGVSDWLSFATTSVIGGGYDRMYQPTSDPTTSAGRDQRAQCSPVYLGHGGGAPTLVIHGALDGVTPLSQAEQLHRSWRAAGTEVDLVVYPDEGHELVDTDHRRDAATRVLSWLTDHGILSSGATR